MLKSRIYEKGPWHEAGRDFWKREGLAIIQRSIELCPACKSRRERGEKGELLEPLCYNHQGWAADLAWGEFHFLPEAWGQIELAERGLLE